MHSSVFNTAAGKRTTKFSGIVCYETTKFSGIVCYETAQEPVIRVTLYANVDLRQNAGQNAGTTYE